MILRSFQKHYNHSIALDCPSLELKPNTKYAVIGANGSGKSTFAKILAGIEKPDDGPDIISPHIRIGYMPQKSYGFRLSVKENLLLKCKDEAKALLLLKELGINELSKRKASKLSGGETARMALARILMNPYDLLILDEPTASMDMEYSLVSEKLILDYQNKTKCICIWITHSISQARRYADEVLFFSKGHLIENGLINDVLQNPRLLETKRFLSYFGS